MFFVHIAIFTVPLMIDNETKNYVYLLKSIIFTAAVSPWLKIVIALYINPGNDFATQSIFYVLIWPTCPTHDKLRLSNENKAWFRRRSFHEPSLIHWIKYMKSSVFESIRNACFNLERLSLSFTPSPAGNFDCGTTLERLWQLWFKRRTFHVPNLMYKL